MILSPGSKAWITKYLFLLRKGELTLDLPDFKKETEEQYLHQILAQSGIIFGFASSLIFSKKLESSKWTSEEKLRLLLFESLLLIYISQRGKKEDYSDFIQSLNRFYNTHSSKSLSNIFGLIGKDSPETQLEKILAKRTENRKNLLESALWFNHVSNTFLYLDLILYYDFLKNELEMAESNYNELAILALKTLAVSAQADGEIEEKERTMFEAFLNSANLSDVERLELELFFKTQNSFEELKVPIHANMLLKRYLLDIAILTIYGNHDPNDTEILFIKKLTIFFGISNVIRDESIIYVEHFVLNNNDNITFLTDHNTYEKLQSNFNSRWVKIISRNKDKLATELKQSKELVSLIKKSATEELSKEEKEKVKSQFLDIVKSVPALAIFMLPGGALLLPIVLKIIPDLIPSAFRNNEIDE